MASSDNISIFGDRSRGYTFFNSSMIRRTKTVQGKVIDHLEIIENSLQLGLNPLFCDNETHHIISVYKGKVYARFLNDISSIVLSQERFLFTWTSTRYYSNEFNFFNISAHDDVINFNFLKWFPNSCIDLYRKEETFSYYFDDIKSGLIYAGTTPVGLKNHSGPKHNAFSRSAHFFLSKLENDKYILNVHDSLFLIKNVEFATFQNSAVIFIATFLIKKPTKNKQVLLSTKCTQRSIYVNGTNIHLIGATDDISLPLLIDDFNFLFCILDQNGFGTIQVNETRLSFATKQVMTPTSEIHLFGKADSANNHFSGQVAVMECFNMRNFPKSGFPDMLREELYKRHVEQIS